MIDSPLRHGKFVRIRESEEIVRARLRSRAREGIRESPFRDEHRIARGDSLANTRGMVYGNTELP